MRTQKGLGIPTEIHDFTGEDESTIEGVVPGSGPKGAPLPTENYTSSLDAAKGTLSSQLEKIQNRMREIESRRGEVEAERGEQAKRARQEIMIAGLQDAGDIIGGVGGPSQKEGAMQRALQQEQKADEELLRLGQEMSSLEQADLEGQGAAIGILQQEEEGEAKQRLSKQLNDPSSNMSKQARLTAELVLGQGVLPPDITAAQLEKVYPEIVQQVNEDKRMGQQMQLEQRKLLLDRQKEERQFEKQMDLQERREMPTLTQSIARRGADVARSYIGAKDALEMVRSGAQAPQKSKATDETLLQGYQRLLQNQAMTYDEDGTPIVNKTLMDQANSKIRGWTEVMKGNQGILPEADRRALLNEAQNIYKIEQGFNVRRLQDMNSWVERNKEKNPTIDFSFVAPGIDPEILNQEAVEFFPKGAGREVYSTTEELAGVREPLPTQERQTFVPGQTQSGDTPLVTSAGRKVFRPGG